jgi:D-alanyl-D-alanine dipeptidase
MSCVSLHAADVLVDLSKAIPTIVVDLRYATENNFTGQVVYTRYICAVHRDLIPALQAIQDELAALGLGLKAFDCFRSLEAQWRFWEILPDERYVSDPRKGGRHTRGTAVDVTLIYLETGEEVVMPTPFDDFTERAWHDNQDATEEQKTNRELLRAIMTKHGFEALATEWWHYDFKGWKDYPVLDVSFEDIK